MASTTLTLEPNATPEYRRPIIRPRWEGRRGSGSVGAASRHGSVHRRCRDPAATGTRQQTGHAFDDCAADGRPVIRVHLKVRYAPFVTEITTRKLGEATTDRETFIAAALAIGAERDAGREIRLLGVRAEMVMPADGDPVDRTPVRARDLKPREVEGRIGCRVAPAAVRFARSCAPRPDEFRGSLREAWIRRAPSDSLQSPTSEPTCWPRATAPAAPGRSWPSSIGSRRRRSTRRSDSS